MQESTSVDRRSLLRGLGGLALVGTIAGCSTDGGGDGGDGGGGFNPPQQAVDYLSDVDHYDGFEDLTGQSSPTVTVGGEPNSNFSFVPTAIRVSTGTTVTWEWSGNGGSHNVVHEGGEFDSGDPVGEAGTTFEHTFGSAGVFRYFCEPHKAAGMKGVVVVE